MCFLIFILLILLLLLVILILLLLFLRLILKRLKFDILDITGACGKNTHLHSSVIKPKKIEGYLALFSPHGYPIINDDAQTYLFPCNDRAETCCFRVSKDGVIQRWNYRAVDKDKLVPHNMLVPFLLSRPQSLTTLECNHI